MIKTETKTSSIQKKSNVTTGKNVCDLSYLTAMTGGKQKAIREIMDVFLKQINQEVTTFNKAVAKTDYEGIKNCAHKMKSSASVMGIHSLTPVLKEVEDLAEAETGIEKIKKLNVKFNVICKHAIEETELSKLNYV